MNEVIDEILLKINNCDDVKNSILGKTQNWKNGHYEMLSQIICENLSTKILANTEIFFILGNSVSSITLKRLYKKQIKTTTHNDLRFRKTLDKLCLFLDYANLNDFLAKRNKISENNKEDVDLLEQLKKIVLKLCKIEFEALRNLETTDENKFRTVLAKKTPYLAKVKTYRQNLCNIGCTFLEDLSSFEVYDFKIISKEKDTIILETEEFWNINFQTKKGIYPYHKRARQTYYFKYEKKELKIWDNYNPDIGEVLSL